MSNIIKFPTWIHEKEKELSKLEFDLSVQKQRLEIAEKKIKNERILMGTRMLLSFCIGVLMMGSIMITLI